MALTVQPSDAQTRGVKFLASRSSALLCFGTGTGKSLIQIMVGMWLLKKGKVRKWVIFGTKASCPEIMLDFETLTEHKAILLESAEELLSFLMSSDELFGVLAYSQFQVWGAGVPLQQWEGVGVCFDEAHVLKNPKSQIRRAMNRLRPWLAHYYGCTATPVTRSVEDYYWLVSFFSPGLLGDWIAFASRYVRWEDMKLKNGAVRRIPAEFLHLDELAIRTKDVVLTYFPEQDIRFTQRFAALTFDERSFYEDTCDRVFEENDATGPSAALVALQECVDASEGKLATLRAIIEEPESECGVIVFCSLKSSVQVVCEMLSRNDIPWRVISGDKSAQARAAARGWFREGGRRVLLITKAGGQSLNLQTTNRLVLYDCPMGVGPFVQIVGRVVRTFSSFAFFDLIFVSATDTIDAYLFELLASKKQLIEKLVGCQVVPHGKMKSFRGEVLRKIRMRTLWSR